MSKESDQALVMLATIAGCIETMRATNSFARVDIRRVIAETFDCCQQAIIAWPGFTNRRWIKARREAFNAFIFSSKDCGYSSCTIACMCERLVVDLQEIACFGIKRELVEALVPRLKIIHDFCDREGSNFPAYEKSDYLLDELYRLIEWEG
jgi:hypothetical protein